MLVARVPPAPLSKFVEILWYAEGWKPPHSRERHMPDGRTGMLIQLGYKGAARSASFVAGPRSEAIFLDTSRPATIIGVHFKSAGAGPFFDVPLSELTNTHAPLADVAAPLSLRDRLLEARSPETRLDILQHWLLARLVRSRDSDPAIAWAVRQFEHQPHVRISAVADHIGRSSRWFIDKFATQVGLTPKVFTRIQRFQLALRKMHDGSNLDLADLAAATGYFDQAHFTHEFRTVAGITPTAYLASRTDHPNHVAVRE